VAGCGFKVKIKVKVKGKGKVKVKSAGDRNGPCPAPAMIKCEVALARRPTTPQFVRTEPRRRSCTVGNALRFHDHEADPA
jgi:hypothetical protein